MTETEEKKVFTNDVKEGVNKIFMAGLGALSVAEEEGSKLFKSLVEKGESYEGRRREEFEKASSEVKSKVEEAAERAKDQAGATWSKVEERVDEAVSGALGRLGVPSRDEIATLTRRVEELTAVVEKLQPAKATTSKKTTKAATKTS